MRIGDYDRRILIEHYAVTGRDALTNAEVLDWVPLRTIWANVQDSLPSRDEAKALGVPVTRRLTRVRYRYAEGVDSKMRMTLLGKGRKVMQIVGGPADVVAAGRDREVEVLCETIGQ